MPPNSQSKIKQSEHKPTPQPARAIYGFFLVVFASLNLLIYILVSYLPDYFLNYFGWDYLPDKYWSIALPAYFIIVIIMIVPIYCSLNMTKSKFKFLGHTLFLKRKQ